MVKHFFATVHPSKNSENRGVIVSKHLKDFIDEGAVHVYIVKADEMDRDDDIIATQQLHIDVLRDEIRSLKEQSH